MLERLRWLIADQSGSAARDCAILIGVVALIGVYWLSSVGGEGAVLETVVGVKQRMTGIASSAP